MSTDYEELVAMPSQSENFDFVRHEQTAVAEYLRHAGFYAELALCAKRIAEEALKRRSIRIHSIEARAKDAASFGKKASKPSKDDPTKPMYSDPINQITDKSAIRIITFFPRTIREIDEMLRTEFSVIEHFDKGENLIEEERFGYQSVHYLVSMNSARTSLAEYERFQTAQIEVQVRTILQHSWAEIEHDIQYKSSAAIPRDIKRRFMSLAGLLEIADREFQAIQDADYDLTQRAKTAITAGALNNIEITPSALKAYLDKTIGPDGRMSAFSYDWAVRLLLRLGFTSLEQVEKCIKPYNDDHLSRLIDGARQGQLTRFEYMLLAGMGEKYIHRHQWTNEPWFRSRQISNLKKLTDNGIKTGWFDTLPPLPGSPKSELSVAD